MTASESQPASDVREAEIIRASRAGLAVDCQDGPGRRQLDAQIIRRCCHDLRDQVDPQGLLVRNAAVSGRLDLAGIEVPFPLRFEHCEFDSPVVAEGARLYSLELTHCPVLPGLLANGLSVRRDLNLSGSQVTGALETAASTSKSAAIWLCESEIGGRLLCVDTVITSSGERSIQADRLRVGGNVRLLHAFSAHGEVRLIGAHIGGSLDLTGARMESPRTGLALDLGEAVIDGSLFLIPDMTGRRPLIRGRVDMGRARIGGQILIRNTTLESLGEAPVGSAYSRARASGTVLSAPRLTVGAEVTLDDGCRVSGGIDLSMSELSSIFVGRGCSLNAPGRTALDLTNAELLSSVTLSHVVEPGSHARAGGPVPDSDRVTVAGTIRLGGVRIRGRLTLWGTHLSDPEGKTLLAAQGAVIDGGADLEGIRATGGRLRFSNSTIGSVVAVGAHLSNPQGFTLSLHQATVRGSVILVDGFRSEGLVSLSRCTIEGRLECGDGTFACPGPTGRNRRGHAVEAVSAVIRGGMYLDWKHVSPSVDLTNATTTFIADDPARWPPEFAISGLAYDRFEHPQHDPEAAVWDAAARCSWLGRQMAYDAGPYEQAARVFRQHGYPDGARTILIAQRKDAREFISGPWAKPRRALDVAYSATVSYGYRPGRVLWLLATLLILVTGSLLIPAAQHTMRATTPAGTVYTTQGPALASSPTASATGVRQRSAAMPDACGGGQVRCFSAFLYAVDTVIPLISLDQRSTWYPDARAPGGMLMEWWLNIAAMLGWLLSSIFVLALANLARSI